MFIGSGFEEGVWITESPIAIFSLSSWVHGSIWRVAAVDPMSHWAQSTHGSMAAFLKTGYQWTLKWQVIFKFQHPYQTIHFWGVNYIQPYTPDLWLGSICVCVRFQDRIKEDEDDKDAWRELRAGGELVLWGALGWMFLHRQDDKIQPNSELWCTLYTKRLSQLLKPQVVWVSSFLFSCFRICDWVATKLVFLCVWIWKWEPQRCTELLPKSWIPV